jgi:hypothetical protein
VRAQGLRSCGEMEPTRSPIRLAVTSTMCNGRRTYNTHRIFSCEVNCCGPSKVVQPFCFFSPCKYSLPSPAQKKSQPAVRVVWLSAVSILHHRWHRRHQQQCAVRPLCYMALAQFGHWSSQSIVYSSTAVKDTPRPFRVSKTDFRIRQHIRSISSVSNGPNG